MAVTPLAFQLLSGLNSLIAAVAWTRFFTQILLEHCTVLVYDESHYSETAITEQEKRASA